MSGTLTINGAVSADGDAADHPAGGGSGGTVWLDVASLAGTGKISADGGASPASGGGGGGRVVFQRSTEGFTGTVSARGGAGLMAGGAGTIFTGAPDGQVAWVLIDNAGVSGAITRIDSNCIGRRLSVSGSATAALDTALTLNSLHVAATGRLTPTVTTSSVALNVMGDATVDAGGRISVDGKGSLSELGSGRGNYYTSNGVTYGTGAGHGGFGGGFAVMPGGTVYGQLNAPNSLGSGGGRGAILGTITPGGSGGGVVTMNVTGALTVNGSITADGDPGPYPAGGGSGGSICINAGTLAGAGLLSANGGAASTSSGGGGGGRVAVACVTNGFSGEHDSLRRRGRASGRRRHCLYESRSGDRLCGGR